MMEHLTVIFVSTEQLIKYKNDSISFNFAIILRNGVTPVIYLLKPSGMRHCNFELLFERTSIVITGFSHLLTTKTGRQWL